MAHRMSVGVKSSCRCKHGVKMQRQLVDGGKCDTPTQRQHESCPSAGHCCRAPPAAAPQLRREVHVQEAHGPPTRAGCNVAVPRTPHAHVRAGARTRAHTPTRAARANDRSARCQGRAHKPAFAHDALQATRVRHAGHARVWVCGCVGARRCARQRRRWCCHTDVASATTRRHQR